MFVAEMILMVIACAMGLVMIGTMVWMLRNSGSRITKKEYKRLLAKYGK